MKLVEHFTSFLKDTVNLNSTRLDQLESSVETLKGVIRDSDWGPKGITFEEQGSWAHKTIIKPVKNKAFDADLLVMIDPVAGWDASKYLSTLKAVFANHGTYKDKVTRCSHCVTIEYAGERKVDLAPCVRNRNGVIGHEVCNFNTNAFERSEPEAYTDWLSQRNEWTGGNGLKKVTRLIKYLRDIKTTFTCPSVLLTTLLGMQITVLDSLGSKPFEDLPTALKTIMGRLDDWLQQHENKPDIRNPVLASESFSRLWDDDQYTNFRELIKRYRGWIDEASDEEDRDDSIGNWRRVFGDDFAKDAVTKLAASVSESARVHVYGDSAANLMLASHDDLVGLVSRHGLTMLPPGFNRLPHKERPPWRRSPFGGYDVKVSATRHTGFKGAKVSAVTSGTGPLPKGQWLRFAVHGTAGAAFDDHKYRVHWRITNTDREARNADALRGGFESPNDGTSRWEGLEYRGVHSAEAFVVRRNDKALVGHSEPFYVVIQ
jgi:hypothetical protein